MANHLRPDVIVNQVLVSTDANIREVPLAVCLIGPHYQIETGAFAGEYIGGMSAQSYGYPDLVVGAAIVQVADDAFHTAPVVELVTAYGTVDITSSCSFNFVNNTFTIPQSITATIDAITSARGVLSGLTLTDTSVNFLSSGVAAADKVYVGTTHYFNVVSVDSEHVLTLSYVNQITTTALDASLSVPDANGNITVTLAAGSVPTGLPVAALRCGVAGLTELHAERGMNVSAATADIRTLTAYISLVGTGVYPDATTQRAWVWGADGDDDWVPLFKVISYTGARTLSVEDGAHAPSDVTTLSNAAFEIINYDDMGITGTGTYSSDDGTLTDAGATFVTDGVTTDDIVVNSDGLPIFTISDVAETVLTVTRYKSGVPLAGSVVYTVSTPTTKVQELGLLVTSGDNTVTANTPGVDFEDMGLTVGDYIRLGNFSMAFVITEITDATNMEVEDLDGDPPDATVANQAFCITSATDMKDLLYVNRSSASEFIVRDVSGLLQSTSYDLATVEVTYPASATSLSYTIKKTITGVDVAGSVYVSYMARRFDYGVNKITLTKNNYVSLAGPVHPANPLGLAAHIVAQQTTTTFYGVQVEDDSTEGWTEALEHASFDAAYNIVPLSVDDSVIALAMAHVTTASEPEQKLERRGWLCKVIDRQTTRITGSGGNYNNASGVITLVLSGTLKTTYGVVSGDEVTVVLDDDSVVSSSVVSIVESGGASTLTLVYDGTAPAGFQLVTTYTIVSPELSDADYAQQFADYTLSISNRRLINVFPMYGTILATDTDGEQVEFTVPGYYMCAMEAAKRAEAAPKQPLTRMNGYGFNTIINPFGSSKTLLDTMIDAGNYVLEQITTGGPVYAVRALSTDVSEVKKYEEAVTAQIDAFVKYIRAALLDITGPSTLDSTFLDRVSILFESVKAYCVANDIIKDASLISLSIDPDRPDGYLMSISVTPFYGAATGTVTVYV